MLLLGMLACQENTTQESQLPAKELKSYAQTTADSSREF
jgi:hypothetical protein